jgi:hypothetical protein
MITKHDKFLVRHYSVLFEKKKLVGLHLGILGFVVMSNQDGTGASFTKMS